MQYPYQNSHSLTQVGGVLGALVSGGVLALKEVATATLEAATKQEGQEGKLVGGGSAWELMSAVLQVVAHNSNNAQMSRQWRDTGLELDAYTPLVRTSFCLFLRTIVCSLLYLFTHSFLLAFIHSLIQSVLYPTFCSVHFLFRCFNQSVSSAIVHSLAHLQLPVVLTA